MEQEPVREPEEKSALLTLLPEMAQWSRVPGARFEVEMVVLRESPSLMREGEEEMEFEYEYYDEEHPTLTNEQDSESMEFDGPEEEEKVEENPYQMVGDKDSISSSDSSKKSKRIIEFDEDDQIIED